MNKEEIKRLLDKYYNAESTEEEELTLKEYFMKTEVPDDLSIEKEMFGYYSVPGSIPEPDPGFEERIMAAIAAEHKGTVRLQDRRLLLSITGIAAGLLMLIGSYFFFIHKTGPRDTFSDPEIAYAETMKILYDISYRMNQAADNLEPVSKIQAITESSLIVISQSTQKIEKNMNLLESYRKVLGNVNLNGK